MILDLGPNSLVSPPSEDPFTKLLKNRILWLRGQVEGKNTSELAAQALLLSAEDAQAPIYLFITSPGGSVIDGLGLYDVLKGLPNPLVTVNLGFAASMGQFLLSGVGTPGFRFSFPNARVLLHQPLSGFGGTAADVVIQAELIKTMKLQLATITAQATGKSLEQVIEDGDRDHWYSAEEALAYGFVDHLVASFAELFAQVQEELAKR